MSSYPPVHDTQSSIDGFVAGVSFSAAPFDLCPTCKSSFLLDLYIPRDCPIWLMQLDSHIPQSYISSSFCPVLHWITSFVHTSLAAFLSVSGSSSSEQSCFLLSFVLVRWLCHIHIYPPLALLLSIDTTLRCCHHHYLLGSAQKNLLEDTYGWLTCALPSHEPY